MTAFSAAAAMNSGVQLGRASSTIGRAFLALTLASATPMYAQRAPTDSLRAAADSLGLRLRRAEEAIAALKRQVEEQASSGVKTRSGLQLEVYGRVLVHAARNGRRVNNADDPQFVQPDSIGTQPSPFVFTARQTALGGALTASDILGARFTGDLDVDFYGGQISSTGGRTFPLLRIRTARGILRWDAGELLAGQESPLIAGLNPVSPAAIGTPAFAAAGNLWLWLPQIRGTIETKGDVRFGLQAAVLANVTGDFVGAFDTDVDAAEHSGRPAFESRGRVRWNNDQGAGEVGCGVHVAWIDLMPVSSQQTYALACDARLPLPGVELRAEGYTGKGLRGLGGGGIGQNVSRSNSPLADRGGWVQLNIDATAMSKVGAGCGVDLPTEADVPFGGRLRNQSCAAYGIVRPSGPLFLGLEVRQVQTKYAVASLTNYHISLATGFEF